jgi:uncharacterized repeat protein (TIGR01451 family)
MLPGEDVAALVASSQLRADEPAPSNTLDAVAEAMSAAAEHDFAPTVASEPAIERTNVESPQPIGLVPVTPIEATVDDTHATTAIGERYAALPVELPADSLSETNSTSPTESEWVEVARGQEPADDDFASDDAELEFDEDQAAADAYRYRGQAAFSDRPPTAPQSRYGGAIDATDDSQSPPPSPAGSVDPFAARQQITPLESAPAASEPSPGHMTQPGAMDHEANPTAFDPPSTLPPAEAAAAPFGDREAMPVNQLRSNSEFTDRDDPGFSQPAEPSSQAAEDAFAGRNSFAERNAFAEQGANSLRSGFDRPDERRNAFDTLGDESSEDEGTGRPGERALEGQQQPSLVIQKLAPQEIQVGKPALFQIAVRNVGGRPADAVTVHDIIPQGTRLISTTPRGKASGGELQWDLGTLSVGELRELEVLLMPTAEGEIGSVATVTMSTQASVKTRCTLPQLALRLTAPRQVMIGTEQRVRIELHNPGTGDATGVMLYENVPEELRHSAGPALEFEVGTLRAGETREMELVLSAEKAGTVVNRISARGDGNLQVEQKIEFDVIAPALEVGVEGPRLRYLERPATYTVHVGNPGTATAQNIEIVTKLPKGLRFVSANNLGEYDTESHAVYWSLAELPEGEAGAVELVALPIETGEHEIKIEGKAGQGLEDETSQHVLVEGLSAIMFEVRDLDDPIEIGGETTYEIRIVNQGTKAATTVQVRATVQPGMKIISASGETRHEIQAGGVLFEPLSSLAPKADTVYRVQVEGVRAGDQRIAVEVSTDDIGDPVRKEESTRVFGDQ